MALGSPIGSIGGMESRPFPLAAYGLSKAMIHWTTRKIHEEHPGIVAFVVDPGYVPSFYHTCKQFRKSTDRWGDM